MTKEEMDAAIRDVWSADGRVATLKECNRRCFIIGMRAAADHAS